MTVKSSRGRPVLHSPRCSSVQRRPAEAVSGNPRDGDRLPLLRRPRVALPTAACSQSPAGTTTSADSNIPSGDLRPPPFDLLLPLFFVCCFLRTGSLVLASAMSTSIMHLAGVHLPLRVHSSHALRRELKLSMGLSPITDLLGDIFCRSSPRLHLFSEFELHPVNQFLMINASLCDLCSRGDPRHLLRLC